MRFSRRSAGTRPAGNGDALVQVLESGLQRQGQLGCGLRRRAVERGCRGEPVGHGQPCCRFRFALCRSDVDQLLGEVFVVQLVDDTEGEGLQLPQ